MFKCSVHQSASVAIAFFAITVMSATALAALNNVGKRIHTVESLEGGTVYIHLKDVVDSKPACGNSDKIIACSMGDSYCAPAMTIALAAQLSGQKIEFSVGGLCVGNVTKFTRLRVD